MNWILEGNECTFKTTLAKMISERQNMEYLKGSSFSSAVGTPEELFEHYKKLFDRDNVVFDRSFYSNAVYGPLYNYPTLTDDMIRELEKLVFNWKTKKQTVVIWCKAPTDVLIDRLNKRGDPDVKAEELGMINDKFAEVMRSCGLITFVYDTTKGSPEDFYKDFVKYIMED